MMMMNRLAGSQQHMKLHPQDFQQKQKQEILKIEYDLGICLDLIDNDSK